MGKIDDQSKAIAKAEKPHSLQITLRTELEKIKPALQQVLPKHLTAERVIKVVLTATNRQPDLLEATMSSIVRSVMQAAELGLEIGGLMGEAYLVVFNTKISKKGQADRWEKQAQCIPGYRGLLKLARQSGEVIGANARLVYEGDHFEVDLAKNTITHVPNFDGDRSDEKIKCAYCILKLRDNPEPHFDVMTKAEIEKVRKNFSRQPDGMMWTKSYGEACRKTVVRRTLKYAPLSTERLQAALEHDDHVATDIGETLDVLPPPDDPVALLEAQLAEPPQTVPADPPTGTVTQTVSVQPTMNPPATAQPDWGGESDMLKERIADAKTPEKQNALRPEVIEFMKKAPQDFANDLGRFWTLSTGEGTEAKPFPLGAL